MDRPDLSREKLVNTLRQFSIVNQLFSCHRRLLKRYIIADMLKERRHSRRLLDVGAGGCDIARWLIKTCRHRGLQLDITCIDHDPRVVEYARSRTSDVPGIEIRCAEAMEIDMFNERFDYVLANHLLHHLGSSDVETILKKISNVCDRVFLVNDLLRCYHSYLAFTIIAGILFRRSFAFTDGRISIRKGFTRHEFLEMTGKMEMEGTTIVSTAFPGHIYIVNCRDSVDSSGNDRRIFHGFDKRQAGAERTEQVD
ncbi:MAG: methyltransferase domain-containing protein [Planctomycetes bacterium]|nr:methyltransferase domain-containing protein [Planctomycetota bacterium]